MYAEDRDRIIDSVKESVDEAGKKPEESAYYFVIGLSLAIFVSLIIIIGNIKYKNNQLEVYREKIKNDVTIPLQSLNGQADQVKYLANQVTSLQVALTRRVDFSQFLKDITSNQYKRSKWTSFSLDSEKVVIDMSADNFEDMAKSVKAFKAIPAVKDTELSSVNVDDSKKVTYTVSLIVDFARYRITNPVGGQSE